MGVQYVKGQELSSDWQSFIKQSNFKAFGWKEHMTQVCFDHPFIWFVIKEIDGLPIAYLIGYDMQDSYDIIQIYVDTKHRGQGNGSHLLQTVQNMERINLMILEVRASNSSALGLYLANNFVMMGRRKDYYQDPQEDALVMHWERKHSYEHV